MHVTQDFRFPSVTSNAESCRASIADRNLAQGPLRSSGRVGTGSEQRALIAGFQGDVKLVKWKRQSRPARLDVGLLSGLASKEAVTPLGRRKCRKLAPLLREKARMAVDPECDTLNSRLICRGRRMQRRFSFSEYSSTSSDGLSSRKPPRTISNIARVVGGDSRACLAEFDHRARVTHSADGSAARLHIGAVSDT